MVGARRMSMVIVQSSRFAIRLDMVVKQGAKIFKPNVLNAFGDLSHPSLQSSIIHPKKMILYVVSNIRINGKIIPRARQRMAAVFVQNGNSVSRQSKETI